jgi:hypothetical protein
MTEPTMMSRAERASTSKTFNKLDLHVDQAIDKTWMANEELERLVAEHADQLQADDAAALTVHLKAAADALLAARGIVWMAAETPHVDHSREG